MIYRCYVNKGTDDATDFETNYKSQTTEVDVLDVVGGYLIAIKDLDYATFKSKIDGQVTTWSDVYCKEHENFYELVVEG